MSIEKYYTLKQVSDHLEITQRTLYSYIESGKLQAVKICGRYKVSESALNEFINGNGKNQAAKQA